MKPSKKLSLILTFTMSLLAAGSSKLLGANSLPSREKSLSALSSKSDSKDGSSPDQDVWVWDYLKDKKIDSYNHLNGKFKKAVAQTLKKSTQKNDIETLPTPEVLSLKETNGGIQTKINDKDQKQKILMVTWTKEKYYPKQGDTAKLKRVTWVTTKPQVENFCNQTSGIGGNLSELSREMMLDLRLTQYLGLKPDGDRLNEDKSRKTDKDKDAFVEIWVKKEDLKRPCSDESIDTNKCSISEDKKMQEVRNKWLGKDSENYPFTGLGYTYDWGKPSPVGPSEFVIEASEDNPVEVTVKLKTKTEDYCKNNKIPAPE
jgi:hypothetical protein